MVKLIVAWFVLPLAVFMGWYVYGGRVLLAREKAARSWAKAVEARDRAAKGLGDWEAARALYSETLAVPDRDDPVTNLRIELERARIELDRRDKGQDAVAAQENLGILYDRAQAALAGPRFREDWAAYEVLRDIELARAEAYFAIAWANRYEKAKLVEEWRCWADRACDVYNEVIRDAKARVDPVGLGRAQLNLEDTVNLIRVENAVFEGLPFPSNSPKTADCLKLSRQYREREQERVTRNEPQPANPGPTPVGVVPPGD